jgi:hypothetical protein
LTESSLNSRLRAVWPILVHPPDRRQVPLLSFAARSSGLASGQSRAEFGDTRRAVGSPGFLARGNRDGIHRLLRLEVFAARGVLGIWDR